MHKAFKIYHNTPNGHLKIIKVVYGAGGRDLLVRTDKSGCSILHVAAYYDDVQIVKVLLVTANCTFSLLKVEAAVFTVTLLPGMAI